MSQILIPYNTKIYPAYPVKKNHFILTELTQQLIIKGKSVKIGLSAGRRIVVHLWFQVLFLCVK